MKENTRSRGFASMDAEKQREIARRGGKAAHARGTAHEFTPDEARNAGRKGGERVSHDRRHMAEIGRMGGKSSAARRREMAASRGQPGQAEARPGMAPPEQAGSPYPGEERGEGGEMAKPSEERQPGSSENPA